MLPPIMLDAIYSILTMVAGVAVFAWWWNRYA
jgi:hypothetical protein